MEIIPNQRKAKAKLVSSMLIFGTIGIFVRYIPLPSSMIAMARGFIGTLFLLLFVHIKKSQISWPDIKRNLLILCLSGAFIGINWILLFEAYRYTTVAIATLCYYLAPIFVIVVSAFIFKEKVTRIKLICIIAALLGMVLVSGVFKGGLSVGFSFVGILFGIGAAVFYACVIVLNKQLKGISSYDGTIVQLGMAAVVILPYVLLTENIAGIMLSPLSVILIITVGIIHTGMVYAMYFGSIKDLKAHTIAIFSYIDPIVAILLSALVLKEEMDLLSIVGAVLVLGSTLFSEIIENGRLPRRRKMAHRGIWWES